MQLQPLSLKTGFPSVVRHFLRAALAATGFAGLCVCHAQTDDQAISRTSVLYQPLVWVGNAPPAEEQNQALSDEVQKIKAHGVERSIPALEGFMASYADSPWIPSLRANLGRYYFEHGLYTKALQNWDMAWKSTKDATNGPAKQVADFTLAYWTHLLASLGRIDTLKSLLQQTRGREFSSKPLQQIFNQSKEGYRMMHADPGVCFKCGTFALANAARAMGTNSAGSDDIMQLPSPPEGFSMAELVQIAKQYAINLVPVQWNGERSLVVPSVVHWKENHYVAITREKDGNYLTVDPTFGKPRWLSGSNIEEEASGYFMVPTEKVPNGWRMLASVETDHIFGRGYAGGIDDNNDSCGNGSGGGGGGGGGGLGGGGRIGGGVAVAASCSSCGGSLGGAPGMGGTGSTGGSGTGGGCCSSGNGGSSDSAASDGSSSSSCSSCDSGGDGGNDGTGGGTVEETGMPVWEVSEPYITTWLYDRPIAYRPGLGYPISFKLTYKQREMRTMSANFFGFGDMWDSSWLSYIEDQPGDNQAEMLVAGGGSRTYTPDNATLEYFSNTILQRNTDGSGNLTGFVVSYANGAKDHYGFVASNSLDTYKVAYLTSKVDHFGHAIQFVYQETNSATLLLYVIDADGQTNTLTYTNSAYPYQVTGVQDPFGRTTVLKYDSSGMLTNIIDPVGLSSSFQYDSQGWLENLTTPYGTTSFQNTICSLDPGDEFGESSEPYVLIRAVKVLDAAGGTNLYMLRQNSSLIFTNAADFTNNADYITDLDYGNYDTFLPTPPAGYSSTIVPQSLPVSSMDGPDNSLIAYRDSFHWGPKQYQGLPVDVTTFSAADFLKARMQHWLHDGPALNISQTLDMEQDPSPDGILPGQTTWYCYEGKTEPYYEGTNSHPSCVARVNPDGQAWYRWYRLDQWGRPTNIVETYSLGYGQTPLTRTNVYIYGPSGANLVAHIGPTGNIDDGYAYNANNQLIDYTNAVGDVTSYAYDAQERLVQTETPAGLATSNIYYSSGILSNWVQTRIDVQISRTNSYTYTNDLIYTHTDERGLTTTYAYDNLQRVTSVSNPLGSNSYTYNKLDLAMVVDRMGFSNMFGYDNVRRRIAMTNALGHYTLYNYCTCGALESIQDADGNVTSFAYDNAGHLLSTSYPDNYAVYNYCDLMGNVTNKISGWVSVTNWFNNQGLLYAASNSAGQTTMRSFDVKDQVTNSVDMNGVSVSTTYDNLGRTVTRSYPDTGTERFGYSAFGLVAYTNQLANITHYGFDAARRKIAETNALTQITQYGYDSAGDLISLTDAKGDTTQWGYDLYGRVTNKLDATGTNSLSYQYDADSRLTNRWSIAKSNTVYSYDNVGNLTGVTYHTNHSLSFSYDNMNRLTTMSDGVGTTTFTYTPAGQLASESGPWASDTVAYTYTNRLRSGLNLQQPNASAWVQNYGYDLAARMTGISSPAGTFAYTYNTGLGGTVSASALVQEVALPYGAAITNAYDGNARMTDTALVNTGGSILDSSVYTYNVGNQRTTLQRIGTNTAPFTNTATYTYDPIGEVVADVASQGTTNRLNEQLHYVFDPAGNLNYRTNNALIENFQVNTLNELTANTNGGTLTVMGTTTSPAASVSVNGATASNYSDATFAAPGLPLTTTYTATASDSLGRSATNTVSVSIAATTTFQYDGNGNLTNDGLRSFAYDDENQLIQVWVPGQWLSQFTYDGKMRRRIRQEFTLQGTNWVQTNEVFYVYDGNVVIQERDLNNLPTTTFTRGKDLSGSLEGAGGIGGLLARTSQAYSDGPLAGQSYYHSDGNGNVTMLINSSNAVVAKYLYDAFGNILSKAGLLADANLYRFSSKEAHPNSGLVYYLYRYYDPNLQRWPNRDPIEENGGINLYGFIDNDPVDYSDIFGLMPPGAGYPHFPSKPKRPPPPKPPGNPPADVPINNNNCANNLGYSLVGSNGSLVNIGTNGQTTYPINISPFEFPSPFPTNPPPTNAPPYVGEKPPPVLSPF
jgi:RHS repeat-associated protein